MVMSAPQPFTNIDELLALPDDGLRHELLDGQHVVTPAPSRLHQRALSELHSALKASLADRTDVEVLFSPADVRIGPRSLVQPDLFIIAKDPAGKNREWEDAPLPFLVVEVPSPSTAPRDRGAKRRLYLQADVEEYWIVDLDARLVERWRRGDDRPEMLDETLVWSLENGASGSVDLADLFTKIMQ